MEQSDQMQKGLIHITSSSGYPQPQDSDRLAFSAFIDGILAFIKDFKEDRSLFFVAFDTGEYIFQTGDSSPIYLIALLINDALRKKSIASVGRKHLTLANFAALMLPLSCYFGIYNIALSLPQMLYDRAGGLLEPLSDEELHILANDAVENMLKRRQRERKNDNKTIYKDEEATNFGYGLREYDSLTRNYSPEITYFKSTKKYVLATGEAKHVAETIVVAEMVRLKLFLEAFQGTLRFFDHLTSNPQYQEVQVPIDSNTKGADRIKELVAFLTSLFSDTVPVQEEEPEQKSSKKIRIVEGEVVLPATVTLEMRKEEHSGNMHTYHLTLTDRKHLGEPVPFLLRVAESGEAELFEDDSDG